MQGKPKMILYRSVPCSPTLKYPPDSHPRLDMGTRILPQSTAGQFDGAAEKQVRDCPSNPSPYLSRGVAVDLKRKPSQTKGRRWKPLDNRAPNLHQNLALRFCSPFRLGPNAAHVVHLRQPPERELGLKLGVPITRPGEPPFAGGLVESEWHSRKKPGEEGESRMPRAFGFPKAPSEPLRRTSD